MSGWRGFGIFMLLWTPVVVAAGLTDYAGITSLWVGCAGWWGGRLYAEATR